MKALSLPRRRMWRSGVSRTERGIGVLLLLLLVGIGAAILVKGRHYDPNLFKLDDSLLGEAPSPFARVLPVAFDSGEWTTGQTVERYGPNTLYEKINGRADQYLSYSVQGLEFQSFLAKAGEGKFVDIYLYDMGKPLNAFGIYSTERTPGAEPVDLGQEGYSAGGSIFFHQGQFYAQVIPGAGDEESLRTALELAAVISQTLPKPKQEAVDPAEMLPQEGLDRESVQYVKEDALGLGFLRNAVTANYEIGGDYLSLFLIEEANPEAAQATLEQYLAYVEKYGTVVAKEPTSGGMRLVADVSGFFDVVFTDGAWVGGVSGASAREPAESLAGRAQAQLSAGGPEAT